MVDERLYLNKDHTKLLSLNHQPSWALQPACLPGRSWLPNGHCCYLCCCSSQRHPTDSWRYPPKMLIGEAKSGLLKPMESSWSTVSMRMCRKSDHGTWTRDSLPGKRLSLPHHGCTAEVFSGTQHSTLMTTHRYVGVQSFQIMNHRESCLWEIWSLVHYEKTVIC